MNQIPILINRKGSLEGDLAFKIFPLERKVTISHRRQKTFDSIEKPNYQQRKHDTLDPKKIRGESRYRRISSSGGANKFPKDFFNQNLPRTPIKIRFSRSKKEYLQQSQSILKPANNDSKQYKLHYQYLKRCVQSPQKNFETIIQVETPKFNHKEINEDDFFQTKSKTTNKKMKVEEYLSHKKQSFPAFFKLTKQTTSEEANQEKPNNFQTKVFKQNPNCENEILLETLGKKQNLLKQAAEQGKKRKRIYSNMEKQNLHQPLFTNKNKKSIKAFLSTKGLNWKILQKINGMKSQPEDKKQNEVFKVKQLRQPVNLKSNNGLSQKFEQNERNTFRIRKFA